MHQKTNQRKNLITFLVCLLVISCSSIVQDNSLLEQKEEPGKALKRSLEENKFQAFLDILDDKLPIDKLYDIMSKGSMQGYYTMKEFWSLKKILEEKYPIFITENKLAGKTYEGRKIEYFILGKDASNNNFFSEN